MDERAVIISHAIYQLITDFISMSEQHGQSFLVEIIRHNFSDNFNYFDRLSVILSIPRRYVPGSSGGASVT